MEIVLMNKRNKKHNKMKGALSYARVALSNLAVWHSESSNDESYTAELINYKSAKSVDVGPSLIGAITKIRHLWNIHLIAVGIEKNGKQRFEVEEVKITEPLLQSQLVDYLNEAHYELANDFKKRNKLTNACWLAVPSGDSISSFQIDNILTTKGAW